MSTGFIGSNLRLARLFHDLSLTDLGEKVGVSKQFLSRIETGAEAASAQLQASLAQELQVLPDFFHCVDTNPIADEQCHFRRQLTTKVALRQVARARGEMLKRLIGVLDEHVELPSYQVKEADAETSEAIERAAEIFRSLFGLGMGPLSSVTRIAENAGAVVMRVRGLAPEIDAISFATKRPLIALNGDGRSACRERFGIAHELGHFSLHIGVLTGDRLTETQANRFASALLLPRSTFATECRLALRSSRLNWAGLSELKLRWGASKAAIIFRARQLGLFTEDQARAGYVGLNRHGEALRESEDHLVPNEEPEVVVESLKVMREHFGVPEAAVAREMRVQPHLLQTLLNNSCAESSANVVRLAPSGAGSQ
ncbi:helix-turn-helix domain-containing protein [Pelomonas aquatica]|jgi:Zn-dependent peptidase ImmA (M78 family)/DNA-binding XRE family transcriptional regulator|uniref:ImmA/IrrE family metallo-endopeptidase n=1 Tax=Pelomonas aquatica TaxID=431058 RepID=A0A9X4LHP9_9BURK|nr:XRE family transcriptional regulator [Pelomonas aquatica]MCY4754651.1 XRE family transcriptional regulator [Pelomonas aquatica]MDG0863735.1 ImmA/IrrE family metallo-endopeptidase [Pelomonas aquatica]